MQLAQLQQALHSRQSPHELPVQVPLPAPKVCPSSIGREEVRIWSGLIVLDASILVNLSRLCL